MKYNYYICSEGILNLDKTFKSFFLGKDNV